MLHLGIYGRFRIYDSSGRRDAMRGEAESTPSISNEALTELALNSAIALDKRLHKEEADNKVVAEFLTVLKQIVDISPEHPTGKLVPHPLQARVRNPPFRFRKSKTR